MPPKNKQSKENYFEKLQEGYDRYFYLLKNGIVPLPAK
jgi:hypothetical protein